MEAEEREDILELLDGIFEMIEEDESSYEEGTPENMMYNLLVFVQDIIGDENTYLPEEHLESLEDLLMDIYEVDDEMVGELPEPEDDEDMYECSQKYFDNLLDKFYDYKIKYDEEDSVKEAYKTVIRGGKRTRKKVLTTAEKKKYLTPARRRALRKRTQKRKSKHVIVTAATRRKMSRSQKKSAKLN